ncbi:MAG: hypothetical protein V3U35_09330 [Candidatus Neomarinimicrobiota bacterium]
MAEAPAADLRTGPERAGVATEPKVPRPIDELRRDAYTTDAALEAFESLLLIASRAPATAAIDGHPLVLTQAAKALVGLRPERPSPALMAFAVGRCAAVAAGPRDHGALKVGPEDLGLTVSVHGLEEAVLAGDRTAALKQLGRLLMVSDNKELIFDVLLQLAARLPQYAAAAVSLVHYAQRAADFVGPVNRADFLLPALEAVMLLPHDTVAQPAPPNAPLSPWGVLTGLENAGLGAVVLAAHTAQISADEHVRQAAIQHSLGRALAALVPPGDERDASPETTVPATGTAASGVDSLLGAALDGRMDVAGALGRQFGSTGERTWLLELLERVDTVCLTPQLIIWADAFRMLYRTAPEEHYPRLGSLAGLHLVKVLAE